MFVAAPSDGNENVDKVSDGKVVVCILTLVVSGCTRLAVHCTSVDVSIRVNVNFRLSPSVILPRSAPALWIIERRKINQPPGYSS